MGHVPVVAIYPLVTLSLAATRKKQARALWRCPRVERIFILFHNQRPSHHFRRIVRRLLAPPPPGRRRPAPPPTARPFPVRRPATPPHGPALPCAGAAGRRRRR